MSHTNIEQLARLLSFAGIGSTEPMYCVTIASGPNKGVFTFVSPVGHAINWACNGEPPNWHIEGFTADGRYRSYKQQYDGGIVEVID